MLAELIGPLVRSRTMWVAPASLFLAAAWGVTGPGSSAVTIDMSVTAFRLPLSQAVFPPFQPDRHVALHGFLSPRSEWADAGRDGTAIHGAVAGCRLTSA